MENNLAVLTFLLLTCDSENSERFTPVTNTLYTVPHMCV